MPKPLGCRVYVFASAFLATFAATSVFAQSALRVRILDETTRDPVAGALIAALGSNGVPGPAVLTSAEGYAVVPVRGSASPRLLVRRIGFVPDTTAAISPPADVSSIIDVVARARRVTLSTVEVVTAPPCTAQAASPSASADAAWTQVRTALEASMATRDQRLVATSALTVERGLDPDGTLRYVDTTGRGRSGERPFVSPAPAMLERSGYFKRHDDGSEEFFAPDERVLLSDGFTRLHCVTLARDVRRDSSGTQLALAFAPREGNPRPEIRGLIWIDSATSELRRVQFEYLHVPLAAAVDSLGGSVSFQHLASGAWIVSEWALRMPRMGMASSATAYNAFTGYIEVGGSARVVRELAIPAATVARGIIGLVFDSLTNRPLAGAHVHLADPARDAIADSLGVFHFDSLAPGVHTVWADHPALDAVGLYTLATRTDLTPRATTRLTLAVPSFATLWHRACGTAAVPSTNGLLFGQVSNPAALPSGPTAARGALVNATWTSGRRSIQPDSTGSYVACGMPSEEKISLSVIATDSAGVETTLPVAFRLGAARVARRDLVLPSSAAVAVVLADTSSARAGGALDDAMVTGVAHDAAGVPVRTALLTVSGMPRQWNASAAGALVANDVTTGTRVVTVGAPGFHAERRLVTLAPEDSAHFDSLTMRRVVLATTRTLRVVSTDSVPIPYANIVVEGGEPRITDEKGELSFGAGKSLTVTAQIRRIGYAPWFGKLEVSDTDAVVTVALKSLTQRLDAVRVSATAATIPSPLALTGFYDRQLMRQKGLLSAVFIGPEEIEFRHPSKISNLLYGLNGVRVIFGTPYSTGTASLKGDLCPMAIMIDGRQLLFGASVDMLPASDVMGIEVYPRGGNMPIALQADDNICGVIALWSGSRK
jgi:hypothetical protein